jgi:hypothetical protein
MPVIILGEKQLPPFDMSRAQKAIAAADSRWFRQNMEPLAERYPNKWLGIQGGKVAVVADSKPELERAVRRTLDLRVPVTIGQMLVDPGPEKMAQVAKNPLSAGIVFSRNGDQVQRMYIQPRVKEDDGGENPEDCDAGEVMEHLMDLKYRSVSFDLHGTLLLPKRGWNARIYEAVRGVLVENGCLGEVERFEGIVGETMDPADFVSTISTDYYRRADTLLETMPEIMQHSKERWVMANAYTIAEITTGHCDNVEILLRKLGRGDPKKGIAPLIEMSRDVQRRISGSGPEDWYATPAERRIIDTAVERGMLISIISNGTHASVVDCARRYFPEIPAWQVFTPEIMRGTGKPSLTNSALFVFGLGCAIVRNAMEGRRAPEEVAQAVPRQRDHIAERWKKAKAAARDMLYTEVTEAQKKESTADVFGLVRKAVHEFCVRMEMRGNVEDCLIVAPHNHLHVGNSKYHDSLPTVGLSLGFKYIFYSAHDENHEECSEHGPDLDVLWGNKD